jgi:hypothetical protein
MVKQSTVVRYSSNLSPKLGRFLSAKLHMDYSLWGDR